MSMILKLNVGVWRARACRSPKSTQSMRLIHNPSFSVVFKMSGVGINDTCNVTDMLEHARAQLVAALASQLPKPGQACTRFLAHNAHVCVAQDLATT